MILVTGSVWLHQSFRTIDAVIDELFDAARRDVIITLYLISTIDEFITKVLGLLDRGVSTHLIFNDWPSQPSGLRSELLALATTRQGLHIYDFRHISGHGTLHAKAVSVDGRL